jgi:hypothetical protein
MALSRNLFAEVGEKLKTPYIQCVGRHPVNTIHSATAVQAVQINGPVNKWYNVVLCLVRVIFNDTWRQMSVKRIRLYIKAKRKIHNNHGQKEHSTHSSQHQSLFVNLQQILTLPPLPPPNQHTSKNSRSRTDTCDKKGRKMYCK